MERRRALVIEDELELARLVELHLRDWGCEVALAESGEAGLELCRQHRFDVVVLDWMLPGIDGLEVCRRLRSQDHYLPILMLTARSAEIDRVLGLEVGADDYMVKPFSPRELVARVKAILRRAEAFARNAAGEEVLRVGDLSIEPTKRHAALGGRVLELTARELDLLICLARHPGRVYTRSELLDHVWGYGHDGYEHTVNSHINRLRAKLEDDPGDPRYILTVWGVGYKLFEPGAAVRPTALAG
ncbi:MAG: response regulator transcription factor [Holophagales bacterium]|nr:response regulator transcription factor [Holophagales bacterium]